MKLNVIEVGTDTHFVEASHTNFALIVDGGNVTVVDSGYPKDRDLVAASLRKVDRSLGDVVAVLLTHAHADHIGAAEWLRQERNAPVHCHGDEAGHARGEVQQRISIHDIAVRLWQPGVLMFMLNAVGKGGLSPTHVKEVRTFSDGARLDVPGRPVAVHTPGHTSGHVSFHLPDRGVLCSGDALITVDVWNRSDRGPQLIRAPFNHDHQQAIESLQRLEELDAEAVLPGHGRPFRGSPAQAVREARSHSV